MNNDLNTKFTHLIAKRRKRRENLKKQTTAVSFKQFMTCSLYVKENTFL